MTNPKLSIIIPVYNNINDLAEGLQSLAKQTFKDWEAIVVDDGSFDSQAIKKVIADCRLNSVNLFPVAHGGASRARNYGFQKSAGSYILFLDSDVIFLDNQALSKMVLSLDKNPEMAYCYSSFVFGWKKFSLGPYDYEKLKKTNYIPTMAMIRREKFSGFDENLKRFQDWDLWLSLGERGEKGIFINEFLWRAKAGGTMSKWLPKFFYRFSFLKQVKDFNKAQQIVKKKHGI